MKKTMKQLIATILAITCVVAMMLPAAYAVQNEKVLYRYTGISSLNAALVINGNTGKASCGGTAYINDGYNVTMTVALKRDGTTIKSWTDTFYGDEARIDKDYYVTSGHTYQVTVTAMIKTSNNIQVGNPSTSTSEKTY